MINKIKENILKVVGKCKICGEEKYDSRNATYEGHKKDCKKLSTKQK